MAPAAQGIRLRLPSYEKIKNDFDADHGFAFDGVGRPAH
jgi:hypothetical protein